MYHLSDQQIEYILSDIRRNGVETEDLQFNLLDHVCCIVEQNLKEGDDFEDFYKKTIRQFYKKELREIEEETINLLTFKNYYAMKKLMIASGAYSAIAFIIGSFFKIMYWPGTALLLVSAILVFSLIFLPLMFLLKVRDTGTLHNKIVLGIGTLVGMLYCLSILWLVQHWPGKQVIWYATLGISFFVLVPVYFFTGIRKPETKVNTIVATILLLGFLGTEFTMTSLRPSVQIKGRVYTYLQSEELLHSMRQKAIPANNTLALDIQNVCEQIKEVILRQETGLAAIPANFDELEMNIPEMDVRPFFSDGQGRKLLVQLHAKVLAYNATKNNDLGNKIPIKNTILDYRLMEKGFCSNLFALNNITQLQLFLATAENRLVVN